MRPNFPHPHLVNSHLLRNRLGLAIVRNLALQYPSSAFNNGPLLIYLTARDQRRGEAAVKALQNDEQLKKAKALASDGGLASIKYHSLDISKPKSITDFATFLKQEHPEGIDIVVNNAGIAMDGFSTKSLHHFLTSPDLPMYRQRRRPTDTTVQLLRHSHRHTLFPSLGPPRRPSGQCRQHSRPSQLKVLLFHPIRPRLIEDRR